MEDYVSRTKAQTVACPYCQAPVESKCIGKRGVREANHRERVHEYLRVR